MCSALCFSTGAHQWRARMKAFFCDLFPRLCVLYFYGDKLTLICQPAKCSWNGKIHSEEKLQRRQQQKKLTGYTVKM